MRKIVFLLSAGFAGTDSAELAEFDDDITDDALDDEAWQRARNHAESYGVYPTTDMPDDYDEDAVDSTYGSDTYSDNIEGYWEEYDPEKHDALL